MMKDFYSELKKKFFKVIAPVVLTTSVSCFLALASKNSLENIIKENKTPVKVGVESSEIQKGIPAVYELDGHKLPSNNVYLTTFSLPHGRGSWGIHKINPYYCAMRVDYVNPYRRESTKHDEVSRKWWEKNHPNDYKVKPIDYESMEWWKNKKVVVTNPKNGRSAVCAIQDWGPAAFVVENAGGQVIDASPKMAKALFGVRSSGWSSRNNVNVAFAKDQNIYTGAVY